MLYHLDRAKEALRQSDFAVLVEGYMDAIAVARAGVGNVVASCGTSLAEPQTKLLARFTRRIVVNYDPDTAGQAATERSLTLLLEKEFDVRVLALPGGADPDKFIKEQGVEAYKKLLMQAPPYLDYLISRARQHGSHHRAGKSRRAEFPDALRPAPSQSPVAFRMGHAHRFRIARGRTRVCAPPCAAPPTSVAAK